MDEKIRVPADEAAAPPQMSPPMSLPDLKALREAGGRSLADIFEETRVGLTHLEAVENGEYDRLPPPVYARDFIRKYARAIGTDAQPILDGYQRHLASLRPAAAETEIQKPWPEAGRRNRFLFASLAAVIVAGVLVSAVFLYDQAEKPGKAAGEPSAPVESTPGPGLPPAEPAPAVDAATAAPVGAVPPPASAMPAPAATEGYRLLIEAHQPTWIRVTEDRSRVYEALLKPGDKTERTAGDHFMLDIGNAGGINLTFQGKPLGSPGKLGQVVHIRLPEKKESGQATP